VFDKIAGVRRMRRTGLPGMANPGFLARQGMPSLRTIWTAEGRPRRGGRGPQSRERAYMRGDSNPRVRRALCIPAPRPVQDTHPCVPAQSDRGASGTSIKDTGFAPSGVVIWINPVATSMPSRGLKIALDILYCVTYTIRHILYSV
jgi:hypothetical protein